MGEATSIRYLRDYVAIPSVNPMGRDDLDPAIAGEARYAEHVREQLRRLGLDAELVGEPDRPSVVAEARPSGARETILVASHLDTVPVDEMEIDPFDPQIEGGRLYGRGSCDTKGGMAALVAALEPLLAEGRLRKNVVIVGEADEELGSAGIRAVLGRLAGRRPDWAIATEPTELRVVTAHKGIVHARLAARGVAGHSSDPGAGKSAILAIARAVLALEDLGAQIARRRDPRLGSPTLSVGLIEGGSAANIVPAAASLVLDRRLISGEDAASVRAELEEAIAGLSEVRVDSCRMEKGPLGISEDHPCVRSCLDALRASGLPAETGTAAFGTDAGVLAGAGIPSLVLGPGSIRQAHTSAEFVEIRQVEAMTRLLTRLLESGAENDLRG